MGLLDGKKGLILNIANDRSIAWHIANNAIKQGATCGFGYLPMEKMERRVRKSLEEMGQPDAWLHPCDVGKDEDIEAAYKVARLQMPNLDVAPNLEAWRLFKRLLTRVNPKVQDVDLEQIITGSVVQNLEASGFLPEMRKKLPR